MLTPVSVTSADIGVTTGEDLFDQSVEARVIGSQLLSGIHMIVDAIWRVGKGIGIKIALHTLSLKNTFWSQ